MSTAAEGITDLKPTAPHRGTAAAADALAGAGLLVVLLTLEGLSSATFFPQDVAARSLRAVLPAALLVHGLVGACLGLAGGAVLRRVPRIRGARLHAALLPHVILLPLLLAAWAAGDRDWIGAAQAGGVAFLGTALGLIPRGRGILAALAVLGAAAPFGLYSLPPHAPAEPPPVGEGGPDVLLVVLDTVRRDRLALYGDLDGGTLRTPALEELAASGVRFDAGFANSPWSVPSHASLFSGLLPRRHGATAEHLHLAESVPVLAEEMKGLGYATAGFSANPWVSPATGLARGFTDWSEAGMEVVFESRFLLYRLLGEPPLGPGDKGGRSLVAMADSWLEGAARDEAPFFVFVNFTEAHAPYRRIARSTRRAHGADTRGARRASLRILEAQHHAVPLDPADVPDAEVAYEAAIAEADLLLGELLTALDRTERGRNAIVIVVSDHGEMLGEGGAWGHGGQLAREVLSVPFVIRAAGRVSPGTRFAPPVGLIDVAPTVLSAAGGAIEADGVPLLTGRSEDPFTEAAEDRRTMFAEHAVPEFSMRVLRALGREDEAKSRSVSRRAAILPPWRYELASDGSEHLYDQRESSADAVDRIDSPEHEATLKLLRDALRAWSAGATAAPGSVPDLSEGRREQLRALGYLD